MSEKSGGKHLRRRLVLVTPDAEEILESYARALDGMAEDGGIEVTDRHYDARGRLDSLTMLVDPEKRRAA